LRAVPLALQVDALKSENVQLKQTSVRQQDLLDQTRKFLKNRR
jgi:hypothetical protein